MKILMLLENDFADDIRVAKEIYSLHNAGHTVVLAAVTLSGTASMEKRDDCTVYRRPLSGFIHKSGVGALKFPFYFNFWRRYVREILSNESFDVIHIHDLPLAAIGLELKRSSGIKTVLDLHENYPALLEISRHANTLPGRLLSSKKQWRKYEKKCLGETDGIIAVVEEMKERITMTGIDPAKIYVVENTPLINTVKATSERIHGEILKMIYVGGLTWHRGIQTVIKGVSSLPRDLNIQFDIAGDGSYLKDLKKLAADLSLNDRVSFHGKLPRKQAEKLLAGSDVAVIPHLRSEQGDNSSPNKLYEYMASGIPVLASDCRSVKRIIEETGCGETYKYDSPEDFAEKLTRLYNERELLKHFSANGVKACRDKYNWTRSSGALLELYSDLGL